MTVAEALRDLEEEAEAMDAAEYLGVTASSLVGATMLASFGGAVVSAVTESIAGAGKRATGEAAGGGGAAAAGTGAGLGSGAILLIFALQKVSVLSQVDMLNEKMPVVAHFGTDKNKIMNSVFFASVPTFL
jgi:hypothetical protein